MYPGSIDAFALVLFLTLASFSIIHLPADARQKGDKRDQSWQSRLHEKDVEYERFACKTEDSSLVAAFFKAHPLNRIFPICHNDCPIVKCRPVIYFPSIARSARVTAGRVSVHVLVDEQGKTLYARILDGNPLVWAAARKGACETTFNSYRHHKRQGVMHFTIDNSGFLGVPYTANRVR